jgi:hypothetical protein
MSAIGSPVKLDPVRKSKYHNIITAPDLLICNLNIVFFLIVSISFFWFILSEQYVRVVLDKTDIINLVADQNPEVRSAVISYAEANYDTIRKTAKENRKQRMVHNVDLFYRYIVPFISVFVFFQFVIAAYIWKKGIRVSYTDKVHMGLVVLAFVTELVFYFVVVRNWIFIGDEDMYKNLIGK